MASGVQLKRMPLDKWSTREQLCLASAVSCSGDQNWMSVSRTLKLVCGNGTPTRPADWYSQKNCALQYGYMLENVETPKRKKRTSESASGNNSPATVETPTDSILRRLNDERIQELKAEMRREQEEFAQIYRELKALQAGTLTEEQIREMWSSIEKQQEEERVEEMKLENKMREREQQRIEMQRNWRTFAPVTSTNTASVPAVPVTAITSGTADTTTVDMDVEEIIPTCTQNIPGAVGSQIQQQQQLQPATSPLLSSLLKTPGNNTPPVLATNTLPSTANMQSARSTAPTITTLLTSGYVPNNNQPAITLKAGIPPQKAAQLLSSPISGPPSMTTPHNLLSPSQAAPTLSMLLEKNKPTTAVAPACEDNRNETLVPPKLAESTMQGQFTDIPAPESGNAEFIPDSKQQTTNDDSNVNIFNEHDLDDPDPNEEQQLLEVFKNIGNIDELDIDVSAVIDDEEVDFLKDMGADSPNEDTNIREEDADVTKMLTDDIVGECVDKEMAGLTTDRPPLMERVPLPATSDVHASGTTETENKQRKVETISSDDSNDNIPLAAVATLEQKSAQDKGIFQEIPNDVALANETIDDKQLQQANIQTRIPSFDDDDEDDKEHDKLEKQLADLVGANDTDESKNLEDEGKSPGASENSDVIVIPTDDDDSSGDKAKLGNEKSNVDLDAAKIKKDLEADIGSLEVSKDATELVGKSTEVGVTTNQHEITTLSQPPTISIGDTDDDSSTTDISIAMRKDDKHATNMNTSNKYNSPQVRKSLHEPGIRQQHDTQNKTDDESTTQFSSSSSSSVVGVTPVRPPLLRKLRERGRSESPLIESDAQGSTYGNANAPSNDSTNQQRLRRRYSSTANNNNDLSVPNSPASSDRDDSETRQSKRLLLSIFHGLQYSKNASTLQRAFHDDGVRFNEICFRPADMHTIRKQIETGHIRNVTELQRDIMLMCQNGMMLFKKNTQSSKAANALMKESQSIREFVANPAYNRSSSSEQQHQPSTSTHHVKDINKSLNVSGISTKSRSSSRKSQRIS